MTEHQIMPVETSWIKMISNKQKLNLSSLTNQS